MNIDDRNRALFAVPVAVALAALAIVLLRKPEMTLQFTEAELQDRISAKFPLEQGTFPFSVVYSDPDVRLERGSDRIGISFTATTRLLEGRLAKGRLEGDMRLRYEPDQAAIFFEDTRIQGIEIESVPRPALDVVRRAAEPLLRNRLRQVPVHRFNARDLRRIGASGVLKSVVVEDGMLKVVVGVP